jgi:ATP-dependent Clp protease adaptor protein ClpS
MGQHYSAPRQAGKSNWIFHRAVENLAGNVYAPDMSVTAAPVITPAKAPEEKTDPKDSLESGYLVICWDDPVNLMDYVTHVFQIVFGWTKEKAELHMMQVHNHGKSVLTREISQVDYGMLVDKHQFRPVLANDIRPIVLADHRQ